MELTQAQIDKIKFLESRWHYVSEPRPDVPSSTGLVIVECKSQTQHVAGFPGMIVGICADGSSHS